MFNRWRNNKWEPIALAAVFILGLTLPGCGDFMEEFNDAPVIGNHDGGMVKISFADGFGNVGAKCFGIDLVYSSRISPSDSSGRSVFVIPAHKYCVDGELSINEVKNVNG